MSNFLERLETGVVIGDGAMGTLLYERGLPLDRCCEELVLSQSDLVKRVHEDYLAAGAQLIETNTFGANRIKLARHGLDRRVVEINVKAAQLAASLAPPRDALVAGSVGPLGIRLDEARAAGFDPRAVFQEQIGALCDGGTDVIILETFSDLEELKIALSAAQAVKKAPFICSMSFTEDGVTHNGVTLADAFASLKNAGADLVGANCCIGPHALASLFHSKLPRISDVFVSTYPNAGRPQYVDGRYYYLATPAYFAQKGVELAGCGVRLIGGCCGTGPQHIAALREALDQTRTTERGTRNVGTVSMEKPVIEILEQKRIESVAMSRELDEPTLLEIIKKRTLIVTEFDSPKTLRLDKMMEAARALKAAGTDFITVADNSLAILRMSGVAAAHLVQKETGLRALVHLACRDRNLIGTQSELMGMDALGLRHVLALTGDPSKVGDTPGATSVYDLNSITLLEGIRAMNQGRSFGGRDFKCSTRFVAGCSFNPNVKNFDVQVKRLERKIAAGARFVMTQPIFDLALARATSEATSRFKMPVLVGVMPLLGARNAEFMNNEVPGVVIPDPVRARLRGKEGAEGAAEGVKIAREVASEVLSHFHGIYLITPLTRYETTVALSSAIRNGSL